MDELVIINPAYRGSVVWRSSGTAKGRTGQRTAEHDGPTETQPDSQSVKSERTNTRRRNNSTFKVWDHWQGGVEGKRRQICCGN